MRSAPKKRIVREALSSRFLFDEAKLPAELTPSKGHANAPDVLLTGATGLVGTYLLRELLARTDGTIVCIVRAENHADAWRRIADRLALVGIDAGDVAQRVRAFAGDVALARFGLDTATYAELADRVGLVFQNAARLNFLRPYRALQRVNVGSALRTLEFAATGACKRIAYTSTAAVLESPARGPGVAAENADLTFPEALPAGYAQTKWVAESLMAAARERGFAVTIFRPPWILETGPLPSPDFVHRFVRVCVRLGAFPDSTYRWNLVSAEYVARALVALVIGGGAEAVYHLGNAETLTNRELAARLKRIGIEIPLLGIEHWRERLAGALNEGATTALGPLASLFFSKLSAHESGIPADTYLFGRVPVMDSQRTISALAGLGIPAPTVDEALVAALAVS